MVWKKEFQVSQLIWIIMKINLHVIFWLKNKVEWPSQEKTKNLRNTTKICSVKIWNSFFKGCILYTCRVIIWCGIELILQGHKLRVKIGICSSNIWVVFRSDISSLMGVTNSFENGWFWVFHYRTQSAWNWLEEIMWNLNDRL